MSEPLPDHTQTPEQKRAIIERLYAAWLRSPEMRLGQMLANTAHTLLGYIEDEALMDLLEMEWKDEEKQ